MTIWHIPGLNASPRPTWGYPNLWPGTQNPPPNQTNQKGCQSNGLKSRIQIIYEIVLRESGPEKLWSTTPKLSWPPPCLPPPAPPRINIAIHSFQRQNSKYVTYNSIDTWRQMMLSGSWGSCGVAMTAVCHCPVLSIFHVAWRCHLHVTGLSFVWLMLCGSWQLRITGLSIVCTSQIGIPVRHIPYRLWEQRRTRARPWPRCLRHSSVDLKWWEVYCWCACARVWMYQSCWG